MRLCIPVFAKTTREARRRMGGAVDAPGFSELLWELRVDGIGDLDIGSLLSKRDKRVIVTNRRREEGGAFQGAEQERVRILREAVVSGADFVDIEASTAPELVESLRSEIASSGGATRLIVSSHDWTKTLSGRSLRRRLAECIALGADIAKVVTMARTPEDNLKVLSLIPHARKEGTEVIAFCMGLQGRVSRILSPLLGAFLCFAAAGEGEASAPGQMTVREMVEMLGLIRGGQATELSRCASSLFHNASAGDETFSPKTTSCLARTGSEWRCRCGGRRPP